MSSSLSKSLLLTVLLLFSLASVAKSQQQFLMNHLEQQLLTDGLGVGAAVAIIDGDNIDYFTLGYQNKGHQSKNDQDKSTPISVTLNSYFEIGSITKVFTSIALANMVTQGKVQLNESIAYYLANVGRFDAQAFDKITFQSLANHSAGLPFQPDNLLTDNSANPYLGYSNNHLFSYLTQYQPSAFAGDYISYSNLGAGLLAVLLADIEQLSYQQLIQRYVLAPLSLTNTYVEVPEEQKAHLSTGYDFNLNEVQALDMASLVGAGGLKSTITDMAKLLYANIHLHELTQPLYLTQVTSTKAHHQVQLGLGWFIEPFGNYHIYSHKGSTGGFRAYAGFYPALKKGVVILSNSFYDVSELGEAFLKSTLENISLVQYLQLDAEFLQQFAGSYQLTTGQRLQVTPSEQGLNIVVDDQPAIAFLPVSEREFYNPMFKALLRFEQNSEGRIKRVAFKQGL